MIYYYDVKVSFIKGSQSLVKIYKVSFSEIGGLFVFLEQKHKDNYTLLSIKEHKYNYKRF